MKKILFLVVAAALLVMCCAAGCTSVANMIDPVVGTWESSYGTSVIDVSSDGTGLKTVFGVTSSFHWKKVSDGVYNFGGDRYTLSNGALRGSIATYYKS